LHHSFLYYIICCCTWFLKRFIVSYLIGYFLYHFLVALKKAFVILLFYLLLTWLYSAITETYTVWFRINCIPTIGIVWQINHCVMIVNRIVLLSYCMRFGTNHMRTLSYKPISLNYLQELIMWWCRMKQSMLFTISNVSMIPNPS